MRDNTHPEISMRIVNLQETVQEARVPRAVSEAKARRPTREALLLTKTYKFQMIMLKVKTSYLNPPHLQSKQIKMVVSYSKRKMLR